MVVYPIIDLVKAGLNVTDYVTSLEEIMLLTASDWNIPAKRNSINRGIWVSKKKLGSIGISVQRGVTFHGFALNVNVSLKPFKWIHPCGLTGVGVTSMAQVLSKKMSMNPVREAVMHHFETVFGVDLVSIDVNEVNHLLPEAMKRFNETFEVNMKPHRVEERQREKPPWLKKRLPAGFICEEVGTLINNAKVHTVCQEAQCPNIWECFSRKTATFMIMGDRCTRYCRFCAVKHGPDRFPDPEEPLRIAGMVQNLNLDYVVITSVTRDDIPDGGASFFVRTVKEIRRKVPNALIELLIPDFQGNKDALRSITDIRPDVLNHNIETVPRLYSTVRPGAIYQRSLDLLMQVVTFDSAIIAKSGLMLGLGEQPEEILNTLKDLLHAGCQLVSIGQYLQPTKAHLPVERYIPPKEFNDWRKIAIEMGFVEVACGSFVRSSYHAKDLYQAVKPFLTHSN